MNESLIGLNDQKSVLWDIGRAEGLPTRHVNDARISNWQIPVVTDAFSQAVLKSE